MSRTVSLTVTGAEYNSNSKEMEEPRIEDHIYVPAASQASRQAASGCTLQHHSARSQASGSGWAAGWPHLRCDAACSIQPASACVPIYYPANVPASQLL